MGAEVRNGSIFTIEAKIGKAKDEAVPLEEALEMTGFGRYNYRLFTISTVTLLAMAAEIFGTSFVVTAAVCDLNLTTETKGLVAAMPMLGIVLSSHLWGWVADTRGRRTVLLVSMTMSGICSMAASLATSWPALALCKFLAAFFGSASNSVTYALFGESTPASRRNKLVLYLSTGLMAAQAFIAINAFMVFQLNFSVPVFGITYRPWRLLEAVYGVWALLSALLLTLQVYESPKFYLSVDRGEEGIKVLRQIYAVNTGKSPDDYPVKTISFQETMSSKETNFFKSIWEQTTPLFKPPLLVKTLVISYIVIIVYAVPPALLMWTPTISNLYAESIAKGNHEVGFCKLMAKKTFVEMSNSTSVAEPHCDDGVQSVAYITLIIFSTCLALLNVLNSYLTKYMTKRTLVIAYHAIGGISGVVLPFITNIHASIAIVYVFQINLVAMALTTAFTVEVYPTYLRAMGVCITMMVGRGSSFVMISYIGVLLEKHCDLTFYILGAYVLSGALIGILLPNEQKKITNTSKSKDVA